VPGLSSAPAGDVVCEVYWSGDSWPERLWWPGRWSAGARVVRSRGTRGSSGRVPARTPSRGRAYPSAPGYTSPRNARLAEHTASARSWAIQCPAPGTDLNNFQQGSLQPVLCSLPRRFPGRRPRAPENGLGASETATFNFQREGGTTPLVPPAYLGGTETEPNARRQRDDVPRYLSSSARRTPCPTTSPARWRRRR